MQDRGPVHPHLGATLEAGGFFPSTVTMQESTPTRGADGADVESWTAVSGLEALACYVSPLGGQERRREDMTNVERMRSIGLNDYYPAITETMRAVVTGIGAGTWRIVRVEHGEQGRFTRLICEVWVST